MGCNKYKSETFNFFMDEQLMVYEINNFNNKIIKKYSKLIKKRINNDNQKNNCDSGYIVNKILNFKS